MDHRRRAAGRRSVPLDPVDPEGEVATDAVFRFAERVLEANGMPIVVALFAEVPGAWSGSRYPHGNLEHLRLIDRARHMKGLDRLKVALRVVLASLGSHFQKPPALSRVGRRRHP